MNNNKLLKKSLLASLIPLAISANANTLAEPTQLAEVKAKLAGQTQLSTQFIIKYKNQGPALSELGPQADQHSFVPGVSAQSFVSNFKTKLNKQSRYVRPMALEGLHVVKVDGKLSAEETQQYMDEMVASGDIEYIEIDQMLKPFATPSDPQYSNQWHYFESAGGLNLPGAWDKATGAGVTVAVLDTGYRPHADLNANLLPGYDMISNTFVANDGGGRDSDARDPGDATTKGECGTDSSGQPVPRADQNSSWHGTHVAGTVAAVANNGEGVVGVAYGAKVVPVRVLGKCGGLTSDIADGIIWASGGSVSGTTANANPASVINMSLGGSGACSATTQAAINTARSNGAVVVIAAGNDNDNSANYNPGNCSGVVNVASVGRNGGRAYYSNYGANIDVAAPGGAQSFANDPEGVLSTYNSGTTGPASDSYSYSQGTSMAAPHVAGVAALIKQAKPSATPDEIEQILKSTTRSFPATCTNCGTGIVDALAAVNEASGGTTPPTGGNVLENGVAKTGLSGAKNAQSFFTMEIPSGATNVTFTLAGGSGDADLYVRSASKPTTSSYDCRSWSSGNGETCSIDNPTAGTYHVMLNAYSAFSGASLTGNITTSGGATGGGGSVDNVSANRGSWARYTLDVPAGMSSFTVTLSGGSGDADLYIRNGSQPSTSSYDCRSWNNGNSETCTINNPSAGTWHIGAYAYSTFSGVTVDAKYKP
ncbi:S8 family peptidase [Pseudoalteromonas piratica]|uniref:Peptidase S8 n=1 Tax=Pseudoalteromonas piratica TaxID=1348114 RepID=A0A0A7EGV0_9GAMM|nr:S8 family serine peptidase [Pseudoalteromonas piratica]AIY65854.1 peptidase S8 [Pseudoalteromonas piratica]